MLDRWPEAQVAARAALDAEPSGAQNQLALLETMFQMPLNEEAEVIAATLLANAPAWPPAHNATGQLLLKRGLPVHAEAAFRRALALSPGDAYICNNVAVALERQGSTEEAIAMFNEAARMDPRLDLARDNLLGSTRQYIGGGVGALALIGLLLLQAGVIPVSRDAVYGAVVIAGGFATYEAARLILRIARLPASARRYYLYEVRADTLRSLLPMARAMAVLFILVAGLLTPLLLALNGNPVGGALAATVDIVVLVGSGALIRRRRRQRGEEPGPVERLVNGQRARGPAAHVLSGLHGIVLGTAILVVLYVLAMGALAMLVYGGYLLIPLAALEMILIFAGWRTVKFVHRWLSSPKRTKAPRIEAGG